MSASYRRTPVRYAQAVENLDELIARLRDTDFAWMAEELQTS
jgi:hypothetical protein